VFTDNAVLQRDKPLMVWGWDHPGQAISVEFAGERAHTLTAANGRWQVLLSPKPASLRPGALVVRGSDTLTRTNLLVGDVWLCSGQSNMSWTVSESNEAAATLAAGPVPGIRLFSTPNGGAPAPADDVAARWTEATPENIAKFSAVGFYFGARLHRELGVPIGLINSSVGGTSAYAWTPRSALLDNPLTRPYVVAMDAELENHEEKMAQWNAARAEWHQRAVARDPGNEGEVNGWHLPDDPAEGWQPITLPGTWESAGLDLNGAIWFRLRVEVPSHWYGALRLSLGPIDDFDTTYFNGVAVGATTPGTPGAHQRPRVYTVPAEAVRPGETNVIAVRVFDEFGLGGFTGAPADLSLAPESSNTSEAIPLAGEWSYRVELGIEPYNKPSPRQPLDPSSPRIPASLYNAMIAPLAPYTINGFIWYQGESDAAIPTIYAQLFPLLIASWRAAWGDNRLPFYFVQLTAFGPPGWDLPPWAYIRDVQLRTSQRVPRTGMVVIIDLGDANDIHPRDKRPVGERLATLALHHLHGRLDLVPTGPLHRTTVVEGSAIRLTFDHAAGLTAKGGQLRGFEIAGLNRVFHPATARIEGTSVVVASPNVSAPVAVRYSWHNVPDGNLYNGAGLPASPFRTDNWDP
jgi:sialate O-acetylesterase